MKHQPGSIQRIEISSTFVEMHKVFFFNVQEQYNGYILVRSIALTMFLALNELSWHSGASVMVATLKYAFNDLLDIMVVIAVLLGGAAAFTFSLFGNLGGSIDFSSFMSSANTMARLSFGLYEYDTFMSYDLGSGFDGIGMRWDILEIFGLVGIFFLLSRYC